MLSPFLVDKKTFSDEHQKEDFRRRKLEDGFSVLISLEPNNSKKKISWQNREIGRRRWMGNGMMGFCEKVVVFLRSDYKDKNGYWINVKNKQWNSLKCRRTVAADMDKRQNRVGGKIRRRKNTKKINARE